MTKGKAAAPTLDVPVTPTAKARRAAAEKLARRIQRRLEFVETPELVEWLEDFAAHAETEEMLRIADRLHVSTDACLGLPAGEEFVRLSRDMTWRLRHVLHDMPFLGENVNDLVDYALKRFFLDWLALRGKTKEAQGEAHT